jgi:hypothetical protein
VAAPMTIEPSELPRGPFPVRQRIIALVVTQFVVFAGLLTVLGLWPADVGGRGVVLVLLILMTLALPLALAMIAAPIVRHVESLERQLDDALQLYGRARSDALLDGLTELGNHRAFQGSWHASWSMPSGTARRCACS